MVVQCIQHSSKFLNGVLELLTIGGPFLSDLLIDFLQQWMQFHVEILEPFEDPDAFLLISAGEPV